MNQELASLKQRTGELYPPSGLTQEIPLVREPDIHPEVILLVGVADDRIREMVHIYDELRNPGGLELGHHTEQKRLSVNRNQGLGQRVGYRLESRAEASRENHRLHLQDLLNVQFPVGNRDLYVELVGQMLGQMLRAVNGAMLSAGASEADLQVRELSLYEALHVVVHKIIDVVQELRDSPVVLKERDDFLVQSGELTVMLVLARVVDRTAIEDVTASVACRVNRNPFLVGETEDLDFQAFVLCDVVELGHCGEFR